MKRLLFSCGVILLAAGTPPAGADIVLHEQPANAGPLGHYSNEGLMEAADDFTLAGDAAIGAARWYGFSGVDPGPSVTALDFRVVFFCDAAGLPGTELGRQTLSAAVTATGLTITDPGAFFGQKIDPFEAGFTPVVVTGGVPLWLSLVESDAGTPGSGDTAFTLQRDAVAVPAPGTILLSALGVALVGWLRLRRTL